jgi:hypothetical protein
MLFNIDYTKVGIELSSSWPSYVSDSKIMIVIYIFNFNFLLSLKYVLDITDYSDIINGLIEFFNLLIITNDHRRPIALIFNKV